MTVIIGRNEETKSNVSIDLQTLLRTRLLIQANSGGGKSYLIRKILEETQGKVQQIVLDLEGEFSTLREKFDYLLVGKEGDIPVDLRSAELLAKKLLENNISAIIDLYELKHHERILFVKRFLDAMINATKEFWHPCLVVVDEAHIFCPEGAKSESASSVIDLATRGRKRGYCAVLATQRLSKLHKDAAAECNNKLIGRTGLDVDMKRASEELGFTSKLQSLSLRDLESGEFFAFGPAISKTILKTKIGKVCTTHQEVGVGKIVAPAPATEKIKLMLAKLSDLPKQAEQEHKTIEEFKQKIKELNFELRKAESLQVVKVPDALLLEKSRVQGFKEAENKYSIQIKNAVRLVKILSDRREKLSNSLHCLLEDFEKDYSTILKGLDEKIELPVKPLVQPVRVLPNFVPKAGLKSEFKPDLIFGKDLNETKLRGGAMRMLKAVAMFSPKALSRNQIAVLAGFSESGGTFNTYLSELKKTGWIVENSSGVEITQDGLQEVGEIPELPTEPAALLQLWASKFRAGGVRLLTAIVEAYPGELSKEELAERTKFENPQSNGTFKTYLSELRMAGLIEIQGSQVRASKELFLEN